MTLIVCVVSRSRKSGKTSLIEQLTERFTNEGFSVATVKNIHGSFDTAEKDTWRHLEAGAVMTVASTPTEVVTIRRSTNPTLEEVLKAIYIKPELVLVEGYKRSSYPKILSANTASDVQIALKEIPNIILISGPITDNAEEMGKLMAECPEIEVHNFFELVNEVKSMLSST